jgi:hypothetical protein
MSERHTTRLFAVEPSAEKRIQRKDDRVMLQLPREMERRQCFAVINRSKADRPCYEARPMWRVCRRLGPSESSARGRCCAFLRYAATFGGFWGRGMATWQAASEPDARPPAGQRSDRCNKRGLRVATKEPSLHRTHLLGGRELVTCNVSHQLHEKYGVRS